MNSIRVTLVADGASDRVILRIIEWLIHQTTDSLTFGVVAEGIPPASAGLRARASAAMRLFPCDILFVHRDAESTSYEGRCREIIHGCDGLKGTFIPVVPVRMTEAWLLGNSNSIRRAAENPNGISPLSLPGKRLWSSSPDPKKLLHDALRSASELPPRRMAKISMGRWVSRVADLTDDWSHLRGLESFDGLEKEIKKAISLLN